MCRMNVIYLFYGIVVGALKSNMDEKNRFCDAEKVEFWGNFCAKCAPYENCNDSKYKGMV